MTEKRLHLEGRGTVIRRAVAAIVMLMTASLGAAEHWAFQPLKEPHLPAMVGSAAVANEKIDFFINAELQARELAPASRADKATLLRRATFDLTGLPPAPEDVALFLADRSPNSFARVIDRLLASPHYGERWGRHWLDLARYADTAGDSSDYPIPQAYRYRDYVINAFNEDMPYDQFLRDQIAGDLIEGNMAVRRRALAATGFIALARRFSVDPDSAMHLTIEDTLDTIGKSVLGLSLSCARCHDHKYDPVSMKEYYGLYGIFSSTRFPFAGSEVKPRPRDLVAVESENENFFAVAEGTPADAKIQNRGEPSDPGSSAPRGFLHVLGGGKVEAPDKTSGREQLAAWLTDKRNPLTARVIVNRVWQWHFGEGLVSSSSDFGTRGSQPSHPELLDHLALKLMEKGWSLKQLHRSIMLSVAYQRSSEPSKSALWRDPQNRWLSHMNKRRLDAESLRDSILAVSGALDDSPGGKHPFPTEDKWSYTQHSPFTANYDHRKRSVYLMQQRIRKRPFFATFDGVDPNVTTGKRGSTVTPLQGLFLANNPFMHEQSEMFAGRICNQRREDSARLDYAYQLALGRKATFSERAVGLQYLRKCRKATGEPQEAWSSFARALMASGEFMFID